MVIHYYLQVLCILCNCRCCTFIYPGGKLVCLPKHHHTYMSIALLYDFTMAARQWEFFSSIIIWWDHHPVCSSSLTPNTTMRHVTVYLREKRKSMVTKPLFFYCGEHLLCMGLVFKSEWTGGDLIINVNAQQAQPTQKVADQLVFPPLVWLSPLEAQI